MRDELMRREEQRPEAVQDRPTVPLRVDVYESSEEVLLVADIPGVNQQGLSLHLDREQLTIEGRRTHQAAGNALSQEWAAADYRRAFLLPPGVDGSKVSADLREGVLYVHLPKSEAIKPRQINVKVG